MLAKRIDDLPVGQTWTFEPKWDGFCALIFRNGDEILFRDKRFRSSLHYAGRIEIVGFAEFLPSKSTTVEAGLRWFATQLAVWLESLVFLHS